MSIPSYISSASQPFVDLVLPPAKMGGYEEHDLRVPEQHLGNWCWAAVTNGLEAFFGVDPVREQCRIVNDVIGTDRCCPKEIATSTPVLCNVPQAMQPALRELFLERVERENGGTSTNFVRGEIVERQLPFVANLGFDDARFGHFVVVSGFRARGTSIKLVVWDPYSGCRSEEPIRSFRTAFRDLGRWRASYRLQRPPAGGPN